MIRRALPVSLLLFACNELPDVTAVGVHVEIAADPGREPCGGTVAHMDAFVARLSAALSLQPPTGADRFRFYWLENDEFYDRSDCPDIAGACAWTVESYSRSLPLDHELVHNVSYALGYPRPIFVEGLAVAFEGLGDEFAPLSFNPAFDAPLPDLDLHDVLNAPTSDRLIELGAYPLAGAFTAFLIRRHGLDAFGRAYASIGRHDGPARIDAVFRDEFGVSLEDAIAEFEATARGCPPIGFGAKLLECAAPELPWSGDVLVHHRSLSCDQDDVVGPYDGDAAVAFYTLEIREPGGYELRVLGEPAVDVERPQSLVSLVPCASCGGGREVVEQAGIGPRTWWFEPGRYSVRMRGPAYTPTSIGLRLTRVPDFPEPEPPASDDGT